MWIAHLSDLHLTADTQPLYGQVDTRGALLQALHRLMGLRRSPDLLLITGDLADGGSESAYRFLADALAPLPFPWFLVPGNHDDRAVLERLFPAQASLWQGPVARIVLSQGSLILLDTHRPGKEWGWVDETTLDALEGLPREPALLAMHHPPFAVGIPGMDAIACRGNLEGLGAWVQAHVEGLLCGHVHRHVATTFYGVPAQVAPSPAHQIALDEAELAYTLEPGGLLLHDWEPGVRLLSHYLPIQAAPVHFYEA